MPCGRRSRAGAAPRPQALPEHRGGDVTRVVVLPVVREAPVDRVVDEPPGRAVVASHAVGGQREYRPGEPGVEVAVLDPAVRDPDEVALPAGRRAAGLPEPEGDLVAGVDDDVAVVHLRQ